MPNFQALNMMVEKSIEWLKVLLDTPWDILFCITGFMKQMQCNYVLIIKTTHKICLVVLYLQNYAAGLRGHYNKSSDCFEYPKKSLVKSIHPKNACQIFRPKQILELKISNPKNPSIIPVSLEIRSTPTPVR